MRVEVCQKVGPVDVGRDRFEDLLRRRLDLDSVRLPEKTVQRGAHLYLSGSRGSTVYLVQRGWVKSYIPTSCGKVSLIDLHGQGDMVGVPSADDRVGIDSAIALSDCAVQFLTLDQLIRTIHRHQLVENWTNFLLARLRHQQEVISGFVTLDSQMRLATRLLMLSSRLVRAEDTPVRLPPRLTQEELAAMVGTTRSRVGHFLANFERAGLIERSDHGVIVVPARLRRYVEAVA